MAEPYSLSQSTGTKKFTLDDAAFPRATRGILVTNPGAATLVFEDGTIGEFEFLSTGEFHFGVKQAKTPAAGGAATIWGLW